MRVARAGRGLDEVLHYFISEDEQADARSKKRPKRAALAGTWLMAAHPGRLFQGAFAVELARALAGDEGTAVIVSTLPPHRLLPRDPRVHWRVIKRPSADAAVATALRDAVESEPDGPAIVLSPASELARVLGEWPDEGLRGLILPVEASRAGLAGALGALRILAGPASHLQVGVVFMGEASGDTFYTKLDAAARRQLGCGVKNLGNVSRDDAHYKALLHARPVVDFAPDAPSARSILELAASLSAVSAG